MANYVLEVLFQYISCYSLSKCGNAEKPGSSFQYISCYSLSKQIMEEYAVHRSFNTSHVTLYHHQGETKRAD